MSFLLYIFVFLMINRVMFFSPLLGMILYIGLIAFAISNNRRRMRMFQQRQQAYGQQFYQQQTKQNTYQNANQDHFHKQQQANSQGSEKSIKDAIDVEYSEEEL